MADQQDRYVEVDAEQAERLRTLLVEQMKSEPGFGHAQLQERAGVSQPTVTDLLAARAKRYRRTSLSKVSHGVGWTATSIEDVLAGGDPTLRSTMSGVEERFSRIEAQLVAQADQLDRLEKLVRGE